jgi:hypothetical protein
MALVVEDGTGKSDAESYISVADADTYFSNRGDATWAALETADKEQALRKGADYLEQAYRSRWKGGRFKNTQALSWPREYARRDEFVNDTFLYEVYYPSDEVPTEVARANAIMALKSVSGELAEDLTQSVKREKVDVLEVEYSEYSPQYTRYRAVDLLLQPLLTSSGASHKVARV